MAVACFGRERSLAAAAMRHAWYVDMPGDAPPDMDEGGGGGCKTPRCPAPISRLRVEKIEGGLVVAGVVVAANCQIVLPVFGFLFLLVGCVLTAASYRGPGRDEAPDHYAARIAFTGNSRVLGPACIVAGALMLALGFCLCALTRRARRREQRIGFHCPLHGDFYPLGPLPTAALRLDSPPPRWTWCCVTASRSAANGNSGSVLPMAQCPHSQVSSARSSPASSPLSQQCPTPLPFLVTSGSVAGLVPATQLSPDQTFGSIRSLAASREVASFPLSRTPTPPLPLHGNGTDNPGLAHDIFTEIEGDQTTVSKNAPRKSVSIILPDEEKG